MPKKQRGCPKDDTMSKSEGIDASMLQHSNEVDDESTDTPSEFTAGEILRAIRDLKAEFSGKFVEMLSTMQEIKHDVQSCVSRVTHAETRISDTEDTVATLQATVSKLEKEVKMLCAKVDSQENRSRRSNLRLVNLPEGAETDDACAFMESWLPEALDLDTRRAPLVIERCHRLPPSKNPNQSNAPRALIMKFLNFRDKVLIQNAARRKGKVFYKNQQVMFFPDLSAEVHKKQKSFQPIKLKLRQKGIRYGMLYPARLMVTHEERRYTFDTPAEAERFVATLDVDLP